MISFNRVTWITTKRGAVLDAESRRFFRHGRRMGLQLGCLVAGNTAAEPVNIEHGVDACTPDQRSKQF